MKQLVRDPLKLIVFQREEALQLCLTRNASRSPQSGFHILQQQHSTSIYHSQKVRKFKTVLFKDWKLTFVSFSYGTKTSKWQMHNSWNEDLKIENYLSLCQQFQLPFVRLLLGLLFLQWQCSRFSCTEKDFWAESSHDFSAGYPHLRSHPPTSRLSSRGKAAEDSKVSTTSGLSTSPHPQERNSTSSTGEHQTLGTQTLPAPDRPRADVSPPRSGETNSDDEDVEIEVDDEVEEIDNTCKERDRSDTQNEALHPRKKKSRTVFSRSQIFQLESTFGMKRYLNSTERASLASNLNLTEIQIKIWFQNRRNKCKRLLAAELEAANMAQAARRMVPVPILFHDQSPLHFLRPDSSATSFLRHSARTKSPDPIAQPGLPAYLHMYSYSPAVPATLPVSQRSSISGIVWFICAKSKCLAFVVFPSHGSERNERNASTNTRTRCSARHGLCFILVKNTEMGRCLFLMSTWL